MSLLSEILVFAKAPKEESIHTNIWSKTSKILPAFLLCILAPIFTAILLATVSAILGEDVGMQRESLKEFKNSIENFYLIVFIAPLIEELAYRFFLRRHIINMALSLFLLLYFAISLINGTSFYNYKFSVLLPKISMAAIPVMILVMFFKSFFRLLKRIDFKYVFWFSCISFALAHLMNFSPFTFYEKALFPILVIPQFVYGVIFGFMRVKYGFFWGLLIHILINAIGSILHLI